MSLVKTYVRLIDFFAILLPGGLAVWLARFAGEQFGLIPDSSWPSTTADWALFGVVSFVVGTLAHPPAHSLNKLYDRFYARRKRKGGDDLLDWVKAEAGTEVGPNDSYFAWAKAALAVESSELVARVEATEGVSKMFRTLCLLGLIVTVVSAVAGEWIAAGASLGVALLSFPVFAERRFASSKDLYQYLKHSHEKTAAGTPAGP